MKTREMCSRISWLFLVVFLALTCNVQSQDLFRDVEKVKSDMSDLKSQIADLKNVVLELRKAMLQSATAPRRQQVPEKDAPKQEKVTKQEPPVDDAQLTKIICPAVGKFFAEAEAALRSSDPGVAQSGMKKAFDKLNNSLQGYTRTHRASKLLNIYEGLAWDTYTAVELQGSVAGNQKFLQVLADHKRKYTETCPKE